MANTFDISAFSGNKASAILATEDTSLLKAFITFTHHLDNWYKCILYKTPIL